EPEPANFALLEKNVRANGCTNVILEQKAVANQGGKLKLYVSDQNKGDHQIYAFGERFAFVEIDAVRLDDYFRDYTGAVDVVKMDIQGAEALALEGAEKLLNKFPALKLFTEFCPEKLKACGTDPREYLYRLWAGGFRLQKIDDHKNGLLPVSVEDLLQMPEPETNLLCQRANRSGEENK
ncbi:MAG TPA: FkbM family methyltransferase, partial [candidate division Zixibacteria bacterium]|nr:FkbM family methyltransferase [candidate division Zixibacteria bacterium]